MGQEIVVRGVSAEDREGWNPLWQGDLTFYKATLSDEITDKTWRRLIDSDESVHNAQWIHPVSAQPLGLRPSASQ